MFTLYQNMEQNLSDMRRSTCEINAALGRNGCNQAPGARKNAMETRGAPPFVSSARYFQAPSTQANAAQPHSITEIALPQPFLCLNRSPIRYDSVADPGVFLGGGALVSCSTSTPINHSYYFFFAEYQLY